jgi:hypothetical protein
MNKTIYLATLLFALVLGSTSCKKDDTTPDVKKTLEQLHPDWKNLTWSQTFLNNDNTNTPQDYPRISFKFNATGDTLVSTFIDHLNDIPVKIPFINITIEGDLVALTPAPLYGDPNYYKLVIDGSQLTLNEWLYYQNKQGAHRYVLNIN